VTGGMTGDDRRFLAGLRRRLRAAGAERDVDFVEDFGRDSRLAFLASLSVLSVPVRAPEAFGLFVVEAMAAGVPVVQPRHGAFPEVIEPSGAGLLYDPAAPDGLYLALRELLRDPARARELGRRGRRAFLDSFTLEQAAARLQRIYAAVAGDGKAAT
jgi:glycosyltransferase involved in cell wall biosynthesis